MRGIKEISGLCYWLDNQKAPLVKKVLENKRQVSRQRLTLLQDLEIPDVQTSPGPLKSSGNQVSSPM